MSLTLTVLGALPATIQHALVLPADKNPLNDITPKWDVFGGQFTTLWQRILGGFWALALVVSAGFLIHGLMGMSIAKKSHHPGDLRESKKEAMTAGIGFASVAGVAVIASIILTLTDVGAA